MANILLITPMADGQTGPYIHETFINMKHRVAYIDWLAILNKDGPEIMNKMIVDIAMNLKPDLVLIIKGIGITPETIIEIKALLKTNVVGWIFDTTLGGVPVKDVEPYVEMLKELDTFFTVDAQAVSELKTLGINAEWLSEGCFERFNGPQVFNSVQARKYGADIVFAGSIGGIHPNRDKFLKRVYDEGFNMRLYGDVLYKEGEDPNWVKDMHTGYAAINDMYSIVCGSSKIILGLDGWSEREQCYSARLYRTLCAGGFYLTKYTKGMEKHFTPGVHLDTFKDEDEMVEKIIKYLQDDELREKIAKQGQELVMEKHQFKHRIEKIIETFK